MARSFLCTICALEKEQAQESVIRDSLPTSGSLNVADLTLQRFNDLTWRSHSERAKLIKRHLPLDVALAE